MPPIGSKIILSMAFGPRHVRITSATVYSQRLTPKSMTQKKGIVTDLGSRDIRDLGFSSRLPFGGSIWTDGVSEYKEDIGKVTDSLGIQAFVPSCTGQSEMCDNVLSWWRNSSEKPFSLPFERYLTTFPFMDRINRLLQYLGLRLYPNLSLESDSIACLAI
jgi:hypothetical protein